MKTKIIFLSLIFLGYFTTLIAQYPSSYDLRTYGLVSSVKSQQGGTCWTHGTMAAIESNLLKNQNWQNNEQYGDEPNLAEYHLDWWNGFNDYYNADLDTPYQNNEGLEVHMGGDYLVATAYLSRLTGAVRDIDGQSYDTPPPLIADTFHFYYPREVLWFTIDENLNGIDSIKKMIIEYGAVATCMCYDADFIDDNYNHYQPPSSNYLPNHSIAIVGWDDNHEVPAAPAPGAWLCKNSWGDTWGLGGYFWISYYDKWACKEPFMGAVSFIKTEPLQYDLVYYHDYHGWRDTKTDITEAFNKFHSREDTWLKSVSFFTAADSVEYTVKIYGKFTNGNLNYLLSKKSGLALHRGFHTIDLDLPVKLKPNMDFYVYLYLSKGGHPYDRTSLISVLMGDTTLKNGLKEAVLVRSKAEPDQSYYKDSVWHDFYYYQDPSGYQNTGNFCIKGLAKNYSPEKLGSVIHLYYDNIPVEGATVIFDGDTIITDTDGTAIFDNYEPFTDSLKLEFYFDDIHHVDYYSISDTVLILDFYFGQTKTENLDIQKITIYPNPAKDFITIYGLDKNDKIEIFDLYGRKIFETKASSKIQLDITNWESGIYFIRNKNSTTKFVKM